MLNVDDRLIKEVLPKIKPDAFAVLLSIAIHLNAHTGTAFPSNERLQRLTGLGRNSIEKALRTLKESGLLKSSQERKDGNFGKRILSVTTDFIQIFVVASKCAPFTENGGTVNGGTVEPSTVDGRTNYINQKTELIKNLEQINEGEEKEDASLFSSTSKNENQSLKAEKKETPPPNSAQPPPLSPPFTPTGETIEPQPAKIVRLYEPQEPNLTLVEPAPPLEYQRNPRETPPAELRRVNISQEIAAMRTDQTALEGFVIGRKLPRERFTEYLSEFEVEQVGLKTQYKNERELRLHFLNWSGVRYQIAQKRKTQQNGKASSHITRAGSDLSVYQEDQIF